MPNDPSKRIGAIAIILCCVISGSFFAALFQVAILKFNPPPELINLSPRLKSKNIQLARRGQLLDRNGRILAASTIGYKLFVDPSLTKDAEVLAFQLAQHIDIPSAEIERKIINRKDTQYVVIKDLLLDKEVKAIQKLSLRPVGLEPRLVRKYPHGEACETLIGLVGVEHTGLAGFENMFDIALTGESGTHQRLKDSRGKILWISPDNYKPSKSGKDITLSIDVVIQNIAMQRLKQAIKDCNAGGGRVVVASPKTGEILAMVDILNPREGWTQQTDDPQRNINPRLARNRCLTDPYEPGSTFKPFVWSVATELNKVAPDEILNTPVGSPHKTSFGRLIRDAHYYGPATWEKVLIKSMNSGMAIVAERLTHEQMQDAVLRFGFGQSTKIGLGGETKGIITSAEDWSDYTQTSVSMGHEIAVTPLQMIQAFCAFARDGTVPKLRMTINTTEDLLIARRAISPETSLLTKNILGNVMTEGTGRHSQSNIYELFGKSGTAQLPMQDGKGYFQDRYISSFIAGAPLKQPEIVVLCVIDDPDKTFAHYGGVVAGPAVRDIIDSSLEYLGITPQLNSFVKAKN